MAYPILLPQNEWYKASVTRSTITEIHFVDTAVTTYDEVWNCDNQNSGTIKGYRKGTIIYISGLGSGKIAANPDSSYMFAKGGDLYSKLIKIVNAGYLDTSSVTTMRNMFDRAISLTEVDVSTWDTSKVTNMQCMFQGCISLESLDLSSFDTSQVTTFQQMFFSNSTLGAMKLKSIGDTSNWDTSQVTNMRSMFAYCQYLEDIDVSGWDTGKVTTFNQMFRYCYNLQYIDVSAWNTSSCTDMSVMFGRCHALQNLDVSRWNTISATSIQEMFAWCESLTTLDVSNWDVSNVTSFTAAFQGSAIQNLDLSNWNTKSGTSMADMFYMAPSLLTVNVSGWNTLNVQDFSKMFAGSNINNIIGLETWDTSSAKSFRNMFAACSSLKKLDLSNFDTRNADESFTNAIGRAGGVSGMLSPDLNSLREIKLGPNFSFNGNGSCEAAIFPTPNAEYINGADGYWYNSRGHHFSPDGIPEGVTAIYYAAFPSDIIIVPYSKMVALADAARKYTISTDRYSFADIVELSDNFSEDLGTNTEILTFILEDGTEIQKEVYIDTLG